MPLTFKGKAYLNDAFLATNVAETGITIPDVTCVIDSGKHREMRFLQVLNLKEVIKQDISPGSMRNDRLAVWWKLLSPKAMPLKGGDEPAVYNEVYVSTFSLSSGMILR